jgi:hypothetical protein
MLVAPLALFLAEVLLVVVVLVVLELAEQLE